MELLHNQQHCSQALMYTIHTCYTPALAVDDISGASWCVHFPPLLVCCSRFSTPLKHGQTSVGEGGEWVRGGRSTYALCSVFQYDVKILLAMVAWLPCTSDILRWPWQVMLCLGQNSRNCLVLPIYIPYPQHIVETYGFSQTCPYMKGIKSLYFSIEHDVSAFCTTFHSFHS